jgi:hypothetical protein
MGRLTVSFRSSDFPAGGFSKAAAISLCSGLTVCLPLWSILPLQFPAGQLVTFTSGQNALRYLRTHRSASRPKQAIDGAGTFTPLDPRSCRLLLIGLPDHQPRALAMIASSIDDSSKEHVQQNCRGRSFNLARGDGATSDGFSMSMTCSSRCSSGEHSLELARVLDEIRRA